MAWKIENDPTITSAAMASRHGGKLVVAHRNQSTALALRATSTALALRRTALAISTALARFLSCWRGGTNYIAISISYDRGSSCRTARVNSQVISNC